jgi:hypothetical protein
MYELLRRDLLHPVRDRERLQGRGHRLPKWLRLQGSMQRAAVLPKYTSQLPARIPVRRRLHR